MISIIWVISLSLINSILLYFVVYRYLHMLQLYNYKSKEFVYHFFKQSKFKFLVFDIVLPIILLCFIGHLLDYLLKNNQICFYLLLTLLIVYFIYKLGTIINITNLNQFASIINGLCIFTSIYLIVKSVEVNSNHKKALFTLILFLFYSIIIRILPSGIDNLFMSLVFPISTMILIGTYEYKNKVKYKMIPFIW